MTAGPSSSYPLSIGMTVSAPPPPSRSQTVDGGAGLAAPTLSMRLRGGCFSPVSRSAVLLGQCLSLQPC